MIWTSDYRTLQFQDLGTLFKKTNVQYYQYIKDLGIEMDLSKKDQQKIYLHFFITQLCNEIVFNKTFTEFEIIFYVNSWEICDIHKKILKKIVTIFGIKIFERPFTLEEFIDKVERKECEVVDQFELFINKETKPKSFKKIMKYLDKEGYTQLSETYFQDMVNKMAILC